MSTSHLRRSTMSFTSRPSAPQMTSAVVLIRRTLNFASLDPAARNPMRASAPMAPTVRKRGWSRHAYLWRSCRFRQLRKAEDGDEGIVEVRAAGQLDVLDAGRQLERHLPLAVGKERDLGALAGRVPHRDDAVNV